MNKLKYLYSLLGLMIILTGCEKDGIDDDLSFLNSASATNIDKLISISTDNSGMVWVSPQGTGLSSAMIDFGHGGSKVTVDAGGAGSHVYPEGNHTVTITSKDIAGKETTNTYPITVTYRAPEDLTATVGTSANSVSVKASAKYAGSYLVYFGDVPNETGTPLASDATVYHVYDAPGNYNVKVVAVGGNASYTGAAKTEKITPVTIGPFSFAFPITYETAGVNYFFGTFGGGQQFATVANPDPDAVNNSTNVGKFTRGWEAWSGTYSPLNKLMDLTTTKKLKVLVYNPSAAQIGKKLNVELESSYNGAPGNGVAVLKVPVTKSGEWEELVFDFNTVGGLPAGAKFSQLVLRFDDGVDGNMAVIYVDNFTLTN